MYEARDRDGCPTKRYAGRSATPREHLSLATRLRKAIERDEFVLNYQPIVDLERMATAGPAGLASAVTSVEALMRWSDQDRGLVAPAEFMAVAEDTGLIELIGEWVFQEAGRQSRAWLDDGLDMQVGINLSLRQLSQADLVPRMLRSAARAEVGPGQVMLELREATAMTELGVHPGVHQLHAAGFGLALDEFGAGHPSVACLRELPLDQLKLDRNLVRAAMRDAQAETLLSSIITLADRLGVPTVAVGIEHEQELRFLLDRGCRLGQGYLFARPMSAAQLSALCAGTAAALAAVRQAS
jgi:EAL domain-containing protein (putative c-di-GMP-specific phosphodiesterase class I)